MEDQKRRDQFIYESGNSLVSVSNLLIVQILIILFYYFLSTTLIRNGNLEGLQTLSTGVYVVVSLLGLIIIYKIRESGKNLVNSVNEEILNIIKPKTDVLNEDGTYEKYHPNGVLKEKGTIIKSNWYGQLEEYHENGNIKVRGNYTNGKRNGVWEWYDESGELNKTSNYLMGKVV